MILEIVDYIITGLIYMLGAASALLGISLFAGYVVAMLLDVRKWFKSRNHKITW